MRIIKTLAAALPLLLAAPAAHASNTNLTHISKVFPQGGGGVLFFETDGTRTAPPSCATSQPVRWVVDVTSSSGQVMVATLLTAFALHKPVTVYGTATCPVVGDTESVSLLIVDN